MNFFEQTIESSHLLHTTSKVGSTSLIEPTTLYLINEVIAEAKKEFDIELIVFESFRSKERQLNMFNQGVSHLKNVGVHYYGLAADLVPLIDGEPNWDKWDFRHLGILARKHGLIWGGDWGTSWDEHTFHDTDHVQFCSVARQGDLFSGSWYPTPEYRPYQDLHGQRR